jgi:hypothetical protein
MRARAEFEGRQYVAPPPPPGPPELLPENELPWELFLACQSQAIVAGFGGVIGIRHDTLTEKMVRRGVSDPGEQLEVEEKFALIEAIFVRSCNRRISSESRAKGGERG